MDSKKLASGDSEKITQPPDEKEITSYEISADIADTRNPSESMEQNKQKDNQDTISPKIIDENEIKLKERVTQCKTIIAKLKLELNEEKMKLEKEAKELQSKETSHKLTSNNAYNSEKQTDFTDLFNVNTYTASVDSKLSCDQHLMEYEKQLQRYQNTLNMAQIEKKNAIRKQMLAKAFKLKLMEVENQCNVELLRIKQSLQCLEPLQMIVEKWKVNNSDNAYDLNNFDLIPRYPELNANSGSDITNTTGTDDFESKIAISNTIEKHD